MKKILVPALALAAASVALPAAAQSYNGYGQNHGGYRPPVYAAPPVHNVVNGQWRSINQRQDLLNWRITQGLRDRTLSQTEASRLRAEFQAIARLEVSYRRGGLTNWERTDLDRRFDTLNRKIRYERADWNGYRR